MVVIRSMQFNVIFSDTQISHIPYPYSSAWMKDLKIMASDF